MNRNSQVPASSRLAAWAVAIAMVTSGSLYAQAQTGNVFGNVADDKGAALPGVTVTLSGVGAAVVQVTDAQGVFRFVGLSPSTYKMEASLEGFSTVVYETVIVNLNRNTSINVSLQPALEETITVTAETPLLDSRKVSTGATVDQTELEKIPSARDPWVILQTTPGVLVDRVNVGGNESGQQSNYVGNGDDGTNSTWSIDGVEITDIGAIGSSSSYYDFDAFEEMQVSTGGSETSARTGGVGINLVTKRGTNEWRGGGRYIVSDQDWQSDFDADQSDFGAAGPWNGNRTQASFKQGNRIVKVEDYGAEFGGPIIKDRLWVWGSYGKNDISLLTISDFPDVTELETTNGKINAQLAESNSATLFYSNNEKVKIGRNASPTRPPATTWNQSGFGDSPTVLKLEDTHIFSSSFYLTAMYSQVHGGFQLVPQGGIYDTSSDSGRPNPSIDGSFAWANESFLIYQSDRPQDQAKADGSYFFSTGDLSHELKFGVNYRKGEVRSFSRWPGFGFDQNFYVSNYGYYYDITAITRPSAINFEVEYSSLYVQDTLTTGNLTANVGLRYDVQEAQNLAAQLAANPAFPALLPAVSYAGGEAGFDWNTFSPRLGLTYALGAEKQTLLRASYSRFAEQLSGGVASWLNPGYPASYVYAYYVDANGDLHAQQSEIVLPGLFSTQSYNPFNPSQLVQSNQVESGYNAPISDELVLGVEHALLPEFVIGLTATYRLETDISETELLVFDGNAFSEANINSLGRVHTRNDYVRRDHDAVAPGIQDLRTTLPSGSVVETPVWILRPGVTSRGGQLLENGDREREYLGVALTFNKRLSNQWMFRGNLSWNDWQWNVPDSEREDPQQFLGGGNIDGDQVVTCTGNGSGAKGFVCISSQWSYSMSGMYQVAPDRAWGFNVAAALNGREGYANPYYRRLARGNNITNCVGGYCSTIVDPVEFKNDDVHTVDLRIEKEFQFDPIGLTVGVDVFNALNEGTGLQRQLRLNQPTGDHLFEVLSPRIFRLGARISFN